MSPETSTPAQLGFRWPAEWEPHAATWLAWPHNRDTWPDKFEPIPAVWTELVRRLAEHEAVNVLAGGSDVMRNAETHIGSLENVVLHDISTNDAWTRDHGPVFLKHPADDTSALVDWQYNAWGGKYPPFDDDNDVPRRIADTQNMQRFGVDLVLEAGAIDGNGLGCVLASENCLLNANRNPSVSKAAMQRALCAYLCAEKVLWIRAELAGDDTDGHVDQLARIVGPRTVLVVAEDDSDDENYASLANLHRQLREMTDQNGKRIETISLPMPRPIYFKGQRLPASYANFYIANNVVIVPQFEDAADERAASIIGEHFPEREVVGIRAVDLIWGLGAFHCITQQQPA